MITAIRTSIYALRTPWFSVQHRLLSVSQVKSGKQRVYKKEKINKPFFEGLFTPKGRKTIGRKREGLPSASEAPDLQCVFMSELELYIVYLPFLNASFFPIASYIDYMYIIGKVNPELQLGVLFLNTYCLFMIYIFVILTKRFPIRMYYEEKCDKTIATFYHPFIPFKFIVKEIEHHSLVKKENFLNISKLPIYHNADIKLFLDANDFRVPADYHRLIK